ncbi:VOC family protein [Cohnella silvisoli]|uniref:VOC family protein n=1 Tax=Cohnella silvisoli TaxID=2873699 RepID=A0ABV1KUH2_9BACL|nr:VOC family protein [Cohnella silvisoli]MCD9023122.1 VOC family protein [Cohnella silvisoli]
MPNPVVHFEITGKDGAKLQNYYKELFQWEINANNPMNYGMVDTQSGGINGGISGSDGGPGYVTIYVEVADLQATLDKAVELGGKIIMPITEIPDMVTMALFTDIENNIVGIIKARG